LTLQGLAQAYMVDFPDRAAAARRRLDGIEPSVLVDRVATATATTPAARP
jgi:hypothetical protein